MNEWTSEIVSNILWLIVLYSFVSLLQEFYEPGSEVEESFLGHKNVYSEEAVAKEAPRR